MKKRLASAVAQPRSALLVVALVLVASGFLRLVDYSDGIVAFASDAVEPAPPITEPEVGPRRVLEIESIMAELRAQEAQLEERRLALEVRETELLSFEDRLRVQLAKLKAAEEALSAKIAYASTAAEDDLARLTQVYENMKPKNAAILFEEMDHEFAAGFLARMRPEAAASIMAGLTPTTAYSISVILAGRNANAPAE